MEKLGDRLWCPELAYSAVKKAGSSTVSVGNGHVLPAGPLRTRLREDARNILLDHTDGHSRLLGVMSVRSLSAFYNNLPFLTC